MKKHHDHRCCATHQHNKEAVAASSTKGPFVCPMDPEVVRDVPGTCPKCGMDLVPIHRDGKGHGGHADMEQSFKQRFFLGIPVTFLILLLSPKIQEWFGYTLDFSGRAWVVFALASVVVWYAGLPFYQMAKGELAARAPAMMSLVSLAVFSGYFFSVAAMFLFPGESLYWEVSTLVLAFLFGHWIEMRAVRGATGALAELAQLIPPTAHKMVGKETQDVLTDALKKGDVVLVRPGEKVPIDGVVVAGESSVNEAMVTGESRPVGKKEGDAVIGGTMNNDGSLTVRVAKTGDETAVAQMMILVREAQETKPHVQKLADRAAGFLTYTALTVGIGTFLFWFVLYPQGAVFAATLAIAVIVIACPHALGLAIPTVTTITTGLAAKNGILIRDMRAIEIARKLSTVVFDKTGTLTKGAFGVSRIEAIGAVSERDILRYAAAVEFSSQHAIGRGIVDAAKERRIRFSPATHFRSFPGKGAIGMVGGQKIVVGNLVFMAEQGVRGAVGTESAKTMIWIAAGKRLLGSLVVEDVVRPESAEAIRALQNMGIKTAILTGDNRAIASSVATTLGVDTVLAEVLPEEKVEKIKELQDHGEVVAMVGDGVNDAASLTQAHVGIAIGAGTDVAIESAEIILVKDDPRDVVKAIRLSRLTRAKMVQNLAWAAGYNLIAIPLAAGLLFPFGILLRPEWAALLMSASSVIVVVNALSLRSAKLKDVVE